MARKSLPGARLLLFINDTTPIGWGTDISINEQHNLSRVEVLGNAYSEDIELIGVTVDMTVGTVRIAQEPLKDFGLRPEGSTTDLLNAPAISGQVVDSLTGAVIYDVDGAKFNSMTVNVTRDALTTSNVTFQAKRLRTPTPKV